MADLKVRDDFEAQRLVRSIHLSLLTRAQSTECFQILRCNRSDRVWAQCLTVAHTRPYPNHLSPQQCRTVCHRYDIVCLYDLSHCAVLMFPSVTKRKIRIKCMKLKRFAFFRAVILLTFGV